jgi:deoxycytidylate deaminase
MGIKYGLHERALSSIHCEQGPGGCCVTWQVHGKNKLPDIGNCGNCANLSGTMHKVLEGPHELLTLMDNLEDEANKNSDCGKIKVGAVLLTSDLKVVSFGFNNKLPGIDKCEDTYKCTVENDEDTYYIAGRKASAVTFNRVHKAFDSAHEIHAERDALYNALIINNIPFNASICLCTLQPCLQCFIALVKCGVKKIYWKYDYDERAVDTVKNMYTSLPEYSDVEYKSIYDVYGL